MEHHVIGFRSLIKLPIAWHKYSLNDFKMRVHLFHSLGNFGKMRKGDNQMITTLRY